MVWGIQEIAFVGIVAIFIFGAPKVIHWAKSLGTARREFDNALKGDNK
jgi:Sec-independent protein translocase protein TatA